MPFTIEFQQAATRITQQACNKATSDEDERTTPTTAAKQQSSKLPLQGQEAASLAGKQEQLEMGRSGHRAKDHLSDGTLATRLLVLAAVAAVAKCKIAVLTRVGFITSVDSLVPLQIRGVVEVLVAQKARVQAPPLGARRARRRRAERATHGVGAAAAHGVGAAATNGRVGRRAQRGGPEGAVRGSHGIAVKRAARRHIDNAAFVEFLLGDGQCGQCVQRGGRGRGFHA